MSRRRTIVVALWVLCACLIPATEAVAAKRTFGTRALQLGSRGHDVRVLQDFLTRWGVPRCGSGGPSPGGGGPLPGGGGSRGLGGGAGPAGGGGPPPAGSGAAGAAKPPPNTAGGGGGGGAGGGLPPLRPNPRIRPRPA